MGDQRSICFHRWLNLQISNDRSEKKHSIKIYSTGSRKFIKNKNHRFFMAVSYKPELPSMDYRTMKEAKIPVGSSFYNFIENPSLAENLQAIC